MGIDHCGYEGASLQPLTAFLLHPEKEALTRKPVLPLLINFGVATTPTLWSRNYPWITAGVNSPIRANQCHAVSANQRFPLSGGVHAPIPPEDQIGRAHV